jgi:hypothetical protein
LQLSAILPEVDATLHVDDSRGTSASTFAYEIAPPREINVNQAIVDTSQIDMYSPQEKAKQSSMKETLDFTMMLVEGNTPNTAQTQFVRSSSIGSLDDMDKSVDLDALHKVTGLESRPQPSQGYLLYRGKSDEREDHIIGESAPDSPSELGSYTSSELYHHESRPFLFTEESLKGVDIVSHEEVHSSEITAKVTNTSDLPPNVHLPNKVDVPLEKAKPIAKPDAMKKKNGIISFLKMSKSKSPKSKKSTMVEI